MLHCNWVKLCVLTFLFVVCSSGATFAATYYVAPATGDTIGANYICDGTDDNVEIQQALTQAGKDGGGIVYLRAGAYTIAAADTIYNTTELTGDSTAVLELGAASAVVMIRAAAASTGVSIHGFEIDGNDAGTVGTNAYAISSARLLNSSIYNMYIHNYMGGAITSAGTGSTAYTDNISVHDNRFLQMGYHAILVGTRCSNVSVYNNTIQTRKYTAVRVTAAKYVKIYNNNLYANSADSTAPDIGVALVWTSSMSSAIMRDIDIYNNSIYGWSQGGIFENNANSTASPYLTYPNTVRIHHNTIINCGWNSAVANGGIYGNGFNLLVQNNVIDSCKYAAIRLTGADAMDSVKVNLQNNIFRCTYSDVGAGAIVNGIPAKERIYVNNNCFYGNFANFTADASLIATDNLLDTDPLFADVANHDYHLKSTGGRWNGTAFVTDAVTSPCIDAGVDSCFYGNELEDNGDCINIGVYGNTAEASKSAVLLSVCNTAPKTFSLSQNAPNPFNPSTTIAYTLPATSVVKMVIYNVAGQKVATLVNEKQAAGVHTVQWKPEHLASGVFFCRLEAGNLTKTMRLVYMK